jgi:hypothetical protein
MDVIYLFMDYLIEFLVNHGNPYRLQSNNIKVIVWEL